jgi:putative YhdH/YhfP family quinone oxidoreductase
MTLIERFRSLNGYPKRRSRFMNQKTFRAMVVEEAAEKKYVREIRERSLDDLPAGEVLIRVQYSSLNYKDALSATGNKGVTRSYPHTPGIDAAGEVAESASPDFRSGDAVLVTGYDLGMNTSGGFGRYIRVPAAWVVKLPDGLSLKESMTYGTAGFTAALSVNRLQDYGVKPDQGAILVTGATGGVGSLAVAILTQAGYDVTAATGKQAEKPFLTALGAKEVVTREEVDDTSGRPLLKSKWPGVIDTVGGNILSTALRSTHYLGCVTCCGLVASPELQTTVFPFILRGVSLLGIDSVNCPMPLRQQIWQRLAAEWKPNLNQLSSEISLEDLNAHIEDILQGKLKGRTVVDVNR